MRTKEDRPLAVQTHHIDDNEKISNGHVAEKDKQLELYAQCRKIHFQISGINKFRDPRDPLVQEVQSIADTLRSVKPGCPKLNVFIIEDRESEDGYCLPNGNIYITTGLLKRCGDKADTTAFLIAHEASHIFLEHGKEHIQSIEQLIKRRVAVNVHSVRKNALEKVGRERRHEMEADLIPTLQWLDAAGYQPLAGVQLFEELQQSEKGGSWSLSHGTLEDRRINLLSLQYVADIKGIDREEQSVSNEWLKALDNLDEGNSALVNFKNDLRALNQLNISHVTKIADEIKNNPTPRTWVIASIILERGNETGDMRIANCIAEALAEVVTKVGINDDLKGISVAAILSYVTGKPINTFLYENSKIKSQLSVLLNKEPLGNIVDTGLVLEGANAIEAAFDPRVLKALGLAELPSTEELEAIAASLFERAVKLDVFSDEDTGEFDPVLFEDGCHTTLIDLGSCCSELNLPSPNLPEMKYMFSRAMIAFAGEEAKVEGIYDSSDPNEARILDRLKKGHSNKTNSLNNLGADISLEQVLYSIDEVDRSDQSQQDSRFVEDANDPIDIFSIEESRKELFKIEDEALIAIRALIAKRGARIFDDFERIIENLQKNTAERMVFHLDLILQNVSTPLDSEWKAFDKDLYQGFRPPRDRTELMLMDLTATYVRKKYPELDMYRYLHLEIWKYKASFIRTEEGPEGFQNHIALSYSFLPTDSFRKGNDVKITEYFDAVAEIRYGSNRAWACSQELGILFLTDLFRHFDECETPDDFFDSLSVWGSYIDLSALATADFESHVTAEEDIPELIEQAQNLIAKHWDLAKNNPSRMFAMSHLFVDHDTQMRVMEWAGDMLISNANFDDALDLIKKEPALVGSSIVLRIGEELTEKPKEFVLLKQTLLDYYRAQANMASAKLVGIDGFLDGKADSSQEILSAGLRERYDPQAVSELYFESWFRRINAIPALKNSIDAYQVDGLEANAIGEWSQDAFHIADLGIVEEQKDYSKVLTVTQLQERLNRADLATRHLIIRKLMTNTKDGVARDPKAMKAVMEDFLDFHVKLVKSQRDEVERVWNSLAMAASQDEIYFLFASPIARGIFQRSEVAVDREKIVTDILKEDSYFSGIYGTSDTPDEDKRYEYLEPYQTKKMIRWAFGTNVVMDLPGENIVRESLPEKYVKEIRLEPLSGMDALVEVAPRLGAPGPRSLQVLGQYMKIPDEDRKAFNHVYDNMIGQSKIAAFETIKREASGILGPDSKLGKRLGGGSLFTVYFFEQEEGAPPQVVKVLNPNAIKRTLSTIELLEKTLDTLIANHPDRPIYTLIREHLLVDVKQWIILDVQDARFMQDDKVFKARYQGYSPAMHRGKIYIPQSYEPNNQFVKVEEFVEGYDLTEWLSWERGKKTDFSRQVVGETDAKEVASILSKFYIQQIVDGLALSDVHIGNVRMKLPDEKNELELAILDRNFYLELTNEDKKLLGSVISDRSRLIDNLSEYLLKQPENESISLTKQELMSSLNEFIQSKGGISTPEDVMSVAVEVRRMGLKIPLRVTLVLKNINSLDQISKECGFEDGVLGAVKWRLNPLEALKLQKSFGK